MSNYPTYRYQSQSRLMTPEAIKALKNLIYETNEIEDILDRRELLRCELRKKSERAREIVKMANFLLSKNIGEDRFRNFGGKWKFGFNNANCAKKNAEVVSMHYNERGFEGLSFSCYQLDWYPHCGFSFRNYTDGDAIKNKVFILTNRALEKASEEFDIFEDNFYHQVKLLLEMDYQSKK